MFAAGIMSLFYASTVDLLSTAWLYYTFAISFAGIATAGTAAIILGVAAAILLTVGVLVVLYFRWKRFHDIVNATGRWLYAHQYLLTFIPIFGPFIALIVTVIKYWDKLSHSMQRAYNILIKFKNAVAGPAKFIGRGAKFGGNLLQGKLAGGSPGLAYAGNYLVGEQGAEIVHLPRGAAVSPNAALGGMGSFSLVIEPAPVMLDGRQVGEVVFKHRLDRVARR
jgi:hypothetical protein